jgi:hypothetical protein
LAVATIFIIFGKIVAALPRISIFGYDIIDFACFSIVSI